MIEIRKSDFANLLDTVKGASSSKGIALVACVMLDTDGNFVTARCTDYRETIESRAEYLRAGLDGGIGPVAVNVTELLRVVKAMPGDNIELEQNRSKFTVRSGTTSIDMPIVDDDDFPPVQKFDTELAFTVVGADLSRVCSEVQKAVHEDDNRYGLNGVHFDNGTDGVLRFFGSDGVSCHVSQCGYSGSLDNKPKKTLISRKTIDVLKRLAEGDPSEWRVYFGENTMRFETGPLTLTTTLVDGEFPNIEAVLKNQTFDRQAEVQASLLAGVIARSKIAAGKGSSAMVLRLYDDTADVISGRNQEVTVRESVPITMKGETLEIGLDPTIIANAIEPGGSVVKLTMGGPLDPTIVKLDDRDDYYAIVMPMRVE